MIVLLVGSGGREHALARSLARSPRLTKLYAAPGNPGIAEHAECVDLDPAHIEAIVAFARGENVGLVVVGPEAPLVAGLADRLREDGVLVFGPEAAAARLEGSKAFTKALCKAADIPTAASEHHRDLAGARAALDRFAAGVVVKADGLAAGKGVTVAETRAEAEAALAGLFADRDAEVVLEERLHGPEASLFVLADGETCVVLGSAEDHKRVGEGDTGPNTGGMGAFSPSVVLTPALEERALAEIVRPTLHALAAAGTPYRGVLYAGLMLTADGPKLIEYNVRFGDPEAEVLLPRLAGDLLEVLLAVAEGRLAEIAAPELDPRVALTVVVAARGYPDTPAAGGTIRGIDAAEATGAIVFQAGTALRDGRLVAAGGRLLAVTALGETLAKAQAAAYRAVDQLDIADGFWRRDIGARALAGARGSDDARTLA